MDIDIISLIKILWVHSYKIKIILDKNIQKIKYIDKEPINSSSKLLWFKFFFNGVFLNNASNTITKDIILTITVVTYKK